MTRAHDGEAVLATALRRGEIERVALALLLGVAAAARSMPDASIDDLLALLSDDDAADARRRGVKARATGNGKGRATGNGKARATGNGKGRA